MGMDAGAPLQEPCWSPDGEVARMVTEIERLKNDLAAKDDTIRMLTDRCAAQSKCLSSRAEKQSADLSPASFDEWWKMNRDLVLKGETVDENMRGSS